MKIIVNADDYGFDRNRTEAIRECFRRGLLSTTTAMVNMPYCAMAIEQARADGIFNKIGLHLNLTFGSPMTEAIRRCPNFCGLDGRFNGVFHRSMWCRLHLTSQEKNAVRDEVRAQMEQYRGFGLPLMHLDSHHHSHTDPSIARIALPIAREMGFKSVRISRNLPHNMGLGKRIYKGYINRMIDRLGFSRTEYFANISTAQSELSTLSDAQSLEVMVHPLYLKNERMDLNREWDDVDGVLCDTRVPMDKISWISQWL